MTDAEDRMTARARLVAQVQPSVEPTLLPSDIDDILDRNKRASRWVTATELVIGDVILPTEPNGHRYVVTTAGTTTTEPTWPTTEESSVSAGAEFEEAGIEYASVYDVRGATRECWELKAAKASQFIDTGDLKFSTIYRRCMEKAERFQLVVIA